MNECEVRKLKEVIGQNDCVLIDVREPMEYAAGRIEGSKLIPLGQIEERAKEIDRSKNVHLICRTGNRSGKALAKLEKMGFENLTNVKGGFQAWKNEDLPFQKDEKAPWDIERQVRFVAGLLVLSGLILSLLIHPYFLGISAFVGAGLVFSALTNTCTMGMILMKMPWNRVRTVSC